MKSRFVIAVSLVVASLQGLADSSNLVTTTWNGFKRDEFKLNGVNCIVVAPAQPSKGASWVWRPEFFGHEPQSDIALLSNGFFAVYINMSNSFGCPKAMEQMDTFYDHLRKTYNVGEKCTLSGFSRGGLYSMNWAARHPDRVACIYLDNAVCDFKSWPGGKGKGKGSKGDWAKLQKVYGFETEQAALEYKLNPIDNLKPIAEKKIPILGVCGDSDKTVPYEENFKIVKERYQALGGPVTEIMKPGCDHHPHSLKDPTPIVEFILKAQPPQK
jgi:pimeloyl-ACP methyl ester carboxylesterase